MLNTIVDALLLYRIKELESERNKLNVNIKVTQALLSEVTK
jgi:hypothetical protein